MKKMLSRVAVSVFFLVVCLMPVAKAEDGTFILDYLKDKGIEVDVSASIDFYDKYVWRGFLLDDDCVLQPGVTIAVGGFEGGFWGSWDLQGDDALASDEVDGWIGYGFDLGFLGDSWKKVSLSLGHTWYDFPEANLYTKEFYLGVAFDTFLSPYVTWYSDYEDEAHGGADGNYIIAGIGHSLTLSDEYGISLDLGLEGGYNDNAFIDGKGSYLSSSVGISIPLTEKVSISPNIGYSVPFGDLKSGGGNDQDAQFYSGISLACSF